VHRLSAHEEIEADQHDGERAAAKDEDGGEE
jgi:hypothetical protein